MILTRFWADLRQRAGGHTAADAVMLFHPSSSQVRLGSIGVVPRPDSHAVYEFGINCTSVYLWIKSYKEQGEAALQSKSKGRPAGGKLSKKQEESIKNRCLVKLLDS
ncbi:MAG: helix-turn-helix domain-containing protein [Desulfovibrio sp.]|jgi:hypothetical protein|nr:helix-turn-helix domain-containing protein [Desulfovibrio sp.]